MIHECFVSKLVRLHDPNPHKQIFKIFKTWTSRKILKSFALQNFYCLFKFLKLHDPNSHEKIFKFTLRQEKVL